MANIITNILSKFFGKKSDRDIQDVTPYVEQTNSLFAQYQSLTNDEIRAKSAELKQKVKDNNSSLQAEVDSLKAKIAEEEDANIKEQHYEKIDTLEKQLTEKTEATLNAILPEAFALVKETSRRFAENEEIEVTATSRDRELAAKERDFVEIDGEKAVYFNSWEAAGSEVKWEMVHYDVQLIGGAILHQGKIAEMATGEGKTLVATLPVFLNALSGRGVHLVTVNDYLAKRDSEWMTPIFEFHGLTVDCIDKHQPNSPERKQAYLADVTYGTNNEFGFDYLRDNMARSPEDLVQRKPNYAIVDEVDSVLIDDARTPLIISGPTPMGDKHEFFELKPKVEKLFTAQRKFVTTALADAKKLLAEGNTEDGGMALLRCYRGLPKNKALIKFLSEPGIKQQLQKTENFYMQDHSKEMHKVDEELYFTIEEKNNQVDLTEKGIELISDSGDKDFFVLPDIGGSIAEIEKSGASDQEKMEQKNALMAETSIKGERVHTLSQLLKAYTVFEKDTEYVVMDKKVKIVDEQTGRIMEGRRYSDGLHQAIEAKENVKIEAATQTYATVTLQNYFRMYNKLSGMTGTAVTEEGEFFEIYKLDVVEIPTNRPIARDDKDDFVYKTTREKYNAVIDEIVLLKEAGRPVLVGTTSVEISELLGKLLKRKGIKHNVLNAKQHQREAQVVAEAGNPGMVTIATNMAGRGTDIKLTDAVKEAGGLAIIGTERHESRRVDRQLRGRAGRQGDPGSSQFYVSLEDNLMRLFGSDRIAKLMDRMGLEEGEVIQHGMISKSIERAQKKVEENNFGVRKNLLEYDDIMNSQREVIYSKRRHALYGERLGVDVANMIYDVCEDVADAGYATFDDFKLELIRQFAIDSPVTEEEYSNAKPEQLAETIYKAAAAQYRLKKEIIAKNVLPIVADVYQNQANTYQNMVFPFSDGTSVIEVVSNLEKGFTSNGKSVNTDIEKSIILGKIDEAWKEHLREMDDLRQSVQNARFEQKDPLLIYKFESFKLFKEMLARVNSDIIAFLLKANLPVQQEPQVQQVEDVPHTDMSNTQVSRSALPEFMTSNQNSTGEALPTGGEQQKQQPVKAETKVGRNDPCPCGSGKKFKQCHGKHA